MARRRKQDKIDDPHERARLKKLRAAQRREERKKRRESGEASPREKRKESSADYSQPMVKDDFLWIRKELAKGYALKILNGHKQRPYWLCVAHAKGDGVLPVPNFYPCTTFRTKTRAYFGFLFREHRDLFLASLDGGVKVTTDHVRSINPQVV